MVKYTRFIAAFVVAIAVLFDYASAASAISFGSLEISDENQTNSRHMLATNNQRKKKYSVKNTCVLANFQTATADFIALNNLVNIVNTSPQMIKQYVDDQFYLFDYKMPTIQLPLFGHTFNMTTTIDWLNATGMSTIKPMLVNVSSSNTLSLGTSFNGTIKLVGALTVEVAQLHHKWYHLCWLHPLHPFHCKSSTMKMSLAMTINTPQIAAHVRAEMYECAPGLPTSVCQNLTMSGIIADAMAGKLTKVSTAIYKNLKDAKINTLALDWDYISKFSFVSYSPKDLFSKAVNYYLRPAHVKLNQMGYYRRFFLDTSQMILLLQLNAIIESTLKPLFGSTCL